MSDVRGRDAGERDRNICANLARLGSEVTALQRSIGRERTGYSGQGVSAGNKWVDELIHTHQEEYCRMKDQHFEETKVLQEEIHKLRKRIHLIETELEISNHNCKELQRVLLEKEQGVEVAQLRQALRAKEASLTRLTAQHKDTERQVAELRTSLEEAISAMTSQKKENVALARKVKQLQKATPGTNHDLIQNLESQLKQSREDRVLLEQVFWKIGKAAGAEAEADFESVLALITQRIQQPAQGGNKITDSDYAIAELRATLSQRDVQITEIKMNAEQDLAKYLEQIQTQQETISALAQEKTLLAAKLERMDLAPPRIEERIPDVCQRCPSLEEENKTLFGQISTLETNLVLLNTEKDNELTILRRQLDTAKEAQASAEARLADAPSPTKSSNEISFLQGQVERLQGECDTLLSEKSEANLKIGEMEAERLEAGRSLEKLKNDVAQKDSAIGQFTTQLREVQNGYREISEAHQTLLQQLSASKAECEAKDSELDSLRNKQEEQSSAPLTDGEESLSAAYAQLAGCTSSLTAAYKSRLQQLAVMAQRLKEAESTSSGPASNAAVVDLQKQLDDERKKRETRVADLKNQIKEINVEKTTLKRRLSEFELAKPKS